MLNTKTLTDKKAAALAIYKAAKAAYIADQSKENWITFCVLANIKNIFRMRWLLCGAIGM